MQRVNQAYAANDLLQLLEMQWECEHIDAVQLGGVSEERLRYYTKVLDEQLRALKQEVLDCETEVVIRFQLPPQQAYTPKKLHKFLADALKMLSAENQRLQELTQLLTQQPQLFKPWLKQERELEKIRQRRMMDEPFGVYH